MAIEIQQYHNDSKSDNRNNIDNRMIVMVAGRLEHSALTFVHSDLTFVKRAPNLGNVKKFLSKKPNHNIQPLAPKAIINTL